jgi:hypothetical protein
MPSAPRPDQVFAIAAGPWPEAEPRLARIVRLSNHGEYEEAARAAEPLLAEGIHDVHVVARFLFGVFLAQGFAALPAICAGIAASLREAAAAIGPEAGERWTQIDLALVWLLRTMRDRVAFHHAQRDAVLMGWVAPLGPASVTAVRAGLAAVGAEVSQSLPSSRMLEQVAALDAFAAGTLRALIPKPRPAPAPAPEPVAAPAPTPSTPTEPPAPPACSPPPAPGLDADLDSPAMRLLREKLAGFEALMQRGDHARAAIVASDVQRIVEAFDPRLYLPRLFAGFYRRLAAGAADLTPHLESEGSLPARALEQLYKVDLHAFLEAS